MTYVVLFGGLAVDDLGALDNHVGRDIRVALDRLERFAMELPRRKVIGAVDGDTATFLLALNLVLAEPEELARVLVERDTAGVGVDEIPLVVTPSAARDNPLGGGEGGEQKAGREELCERHVWRGLMLGRERSQGLGLSTLSRLRDRNTTRGIYTVFMTS